MTGTIVQLGPVASVVVQTSSPAGVVQVNTGTPGASYPTPWVGTQAEHEALGTYDPDRFYIIT